MNWLPAIRLVSVVMYIASQLHNMCVESYLGRLQDHLVVDVTSRDMRHEVMAGSLGIAQWRLRTAANIADRRANRKRPIRPARPPSPSGPLTITNSRRAPVWSRVC